MAGLLAFISPISVLAEEDEDDAVIEYQSSLFEYSLLCIAECPLFLYFKSVHILPFSYCKQPANGSGTRFLGPVKVFL